MMRTVGVAGFVLVFSGLVLGTSQNALAGSCAGLSASANALTQTTASSWAGNRLKNAINRWARKNGTKVVRVGPTSTTCKANAGLLNTCTASARVCK